MTDLEATEFVAELHTIEIGTLGHWEHSCRKAVTRSVPSLSKKKATSVLDSAAKKVVSTFQIIFKAKTNSTWPISCLLS